MYIKKFICGISTIVMIIILVVIAIIFKNKQLSSSTNKDTYIEEQNVIKSENIIDDIQEKNTKVEEIKTDLPQEQEKTKNDDIITPIQISQDTTNKNITKQYDKSSSSTNQEEIKSTNVTNDIKVNTEQNESTIKNQETKQETVKKDTPKNIKSYVRNTTMENTMKEYIENNPSEYMLQYGFIVKPDPSIVNDTNEFTYTEIRVKGKIEKKFGTIRIYAQDVLLDGVYQFTECFIL